MKKRSFLFIILLVMAVCISGVSFLILQQENILRKYFILDPQERMKEYKASLANSLSKYFTRENKSSPINDITDYIGKYGRTSLFDLMFVFRDGDGSMKQISKIGVTAVTKDALSSEYVYPVTVDNGRVDGYLMVMIKETGEAELREGLKKYSAISYSLRFMFILIIAALAVILIYHSYSAKMKLARDIAEMKASNDGLTGLHTHEYFLKELNIEIEKFRIYHTPVALLILDIDYFKKLNDQFGHLAGDRVLEGVSKIIKFSTRATDILARYGGEEFAVIIPYVAKAGRVRSKENLRNFIDELKGVAERIRKNVEDYRAEFLPDSFRVTISIGGAFFYNRRDNLTSAAILQKADRALYKAKRTGRNKACIDYESSANE
ncbi:MAG: GGDEF domain-containing protein [Candidatus Omnitrophota bacterium]